MKRTIVLTYYFLVPTVLALEDITERGHYRALVSSNKYYWFEVYEAVKEGKPAWPIWPQFADVRQYCADMKMKLTLPRNLEENDFIGSAISETWPETYASISNTAGFYVDLTDEGVEGEWRNSAGELVWYGEDDGSGPDGQWTHWSWGQPDDSGGDDDWAVAQSRKGPWKWRDVDDDTRVFSRFFVCEVEMCVESYNLPTDVHPDAQVIFSNRTILSVHDILAVQCPSGKFVVFDGELQPGQHVESSCEQLPKSSIGCADAKPTCSIPPIENGMLLIQRRVAGTLILKGKEFTLACDKHYISAAELDGLSSYSCVAQDELNAEPKCLRECPSIYIPNGGFEGLKGGTKFIEGIPIKRTCVSGMKPSIKEDAVCLPSGKINKKHECIPVPDNTPVIAGAVIGLLVVTIGIAYMVCRMKKRDRFRYE